MREAIQNSDAVPFRPWVLTDIEGVVLDASNNLDRLVHLTRRCLIGRHPFIFLDRDRETIADIAALATRQPATLAAPSAPGAKTRSRLDSHSRSAGAGANLRRRATNGKA